MIREFGIFAGQLRGHTLESKWEVYNEVKKCGFKNMIVASFSHMARVDDIFVKQLVERGEDRNGLYGFSEITNSKSISFPATFLLLKPITTTRHVKHVFTYLFCLVDALLKISFSGAEPGPQRMGYPSLPGPAGPVHPPWREPQDQHPHPHPV